MVNTFGLVPPKAGWEDLTSRTPHGAGYSRKDRLASTQIHDLAWSGTALWIGTNRGLSRYDPIENDWTTYTKANGLVTNYITSVAVDRKNSVAWIGTSLGLGVIQDNRWRFFTQRNGLTDDFVTNVSIFQGEVWAATRSGLNVLQLTPENHQPRVKSHLEDWWVTFYAPAWQRPLGWDNGGAVSQSVRDGSV